MQISFCKVLQRCQSRCGASVNRVASLGIIVVLSSVSLTACTPSVATHGHTLDEAQIAQIEPGRSKQQDVLRLLGSPSSLASFDDQTWYYVSQRTEKVSFYQEELVSQDVVTVLFNDEGVVSGVNRHGLDQTAQVDPVDRVTPTAGEEPSAFEQIIGNIGRFGSGGGGPGGFGGTR